MIKAAPHLLLTSLALTALLLPGSAVAAPSTITLELRRTPPKALPQHTGKDAAIEDLMALAVSNSGAQDVEKGAKPREFLEFTVRIRVVGQDDVFFNRDAVRLEIFDDSGSAVSDRAVISCGPPSPGHYVRQHPGDVVVIPLHWTVDSSLAPPPRKKYTFAAIFEDAADIDILWLTGRPPTPDGAWLVTKRIASNQITISLPPRERRPRAHTADRDVRSIDEPIPR